MIEMPLWRVAAWEILGCCVHVCKCISLACTCANCSPAHLQPTYSVWPGLFDSPHLRLTPHYLLACPYFCCSTGHSTNFVMAMNLPMGAGQTAEGWVKAGVAALTMLDL